LRKKKKEWKKVDDEIPLFFDYEKEYELPTVEELPAIINILSPQYKAVFNLYVFEDMKHNEIATLLNISENTSKTNYMRAKQIIKKELEKKADTLNPFIDNLNENYGAI
jgi:RNA polymerase sigma-70 factor (ECF subfamily)